MPFGRSIVLGGLVLLAASTTHAQSLRCPGDNAAYFEEVQANGWVGFGETWDFDVCDEGLEIYAEGANSRWRAMRPVLANKKPSTLGLDADDILFYSTALPYGAFGTLGLVFVIAWIASILSRRRQAPSVVVTCGGCGRGVPVRPEEGGVFCPACGTVALVGAGVGPSTGNRAA